MNIIVMQDMFGNPIEYKGEIKGYKIHGFNMKSGGWSLYPDKDGTSTPAKFMLFRPYRCRKNRVFNTNRLIGIFRNFS